MCVNVKCLRHIMKFKCYVYVSFFLEVSKSNAYQCLIVDAQFEVQEFYFCGFWSFEGVGGQMCDDVEC